MSERVRRPLQLLVGRLRQTHAGKPLDVACELSELCDEAADAIERLNWAIRGYDNLNPDECIGGIDDAFPCVSHMAYETLRDSVESAGWWYDDESDKWMSPNANSTPQAGHNAGAVSHNLDPSPGNASQTGSGGGK